MSKQLTQVTDSWQLIGAGKVTVTIDTVGSGTLYFNETENDSTAYKASGAAGDQFQQTETLPTYVRASGSGWSIIADGVLS